MQSTTRAPRRSVAALAAGALVAGTTVGVGFAPAHAADPVASTVLTWGVSEQFFDHLSTRTRRDGATVDEAAKTFGFPGTGTRVSDEGTVTRTHGGTISGAFVMAGTTYYSITLADPTVTVEADGDGSVSATVSAEVPDTGRGPAVSVPETAVTVAEFTGATAGEQGVFAVPESFHADFVELLPASLQPHFNNSSEKKHPASILATGVPTVTATVTAATPKNGITVKVDGVGFNPTTLPGDQGVYVGLAPAGTKIQFDDFDSQNDFPAVDWVMPSRFAGDSFTSVLNVPRNKLVKGTDYAIFTWQAHRHSNTTQDTVTPLSIDWSRLEPKKATRTKPAVRLRFAKKANTRRAGRAVVRVVGRSTKATGRVRVVINRPGVKRNKVVNRKLNKNARVNVKLPKAGKRGRYVVRVRYLGDQANLKNKNVKRYRVKR